MEENNNKNKKQHKQRELRENGKPATETDL